MNQKIFYVYVYLDPRKHGTFKYGKYVFEYEPFYVGKGYGDRLRHHCRSCLLKSNKTKSKIIKNILKNKARPTIIKYKENLTEQQSLTLERKLIKTIGRLDIKTGPLTNLTSGGQGSIGRIVSEQQKTTQSAKMKGRKASKATIKKLRIANAGKNNGMYGKHHTEETKEKMKLKKKNIPLTIEHKNNISKAIKGKNNPFYGKHHTEETKRKMKLNHNNRVWTKEERDKVSKRMKGKNHPLYGKHHSLKTRLKIKNSWKRRKNRCL